MLGPMRYDARPLSALLALALALTLAGGPAPAAAEDDPRWVFYTRDRTAYTSPWYAGARRIMIPFGCTRAPYYPPDPRCSRNRGFHHGLDIAMPCGTRIRARIRARVVEPVGIGPAYGTRPLLLRSRERERDILIAHARRLLVKPGDRVRPGQVIARAGDSGTPDGCHLHFEVRAVGGGLSTAVWPRPLLRLRAAEGARVTSPADAGRATARPSRPA